MTQHKYRDAAGKILKPDKLVSDVVSDLENIVGMSGSIALTQTGNAYTAAVTFRARDEHDKLLEAGWQFEFKLLASYEERNILCRSNDKYGWRNQSIQKLHCISALEYDLQEPKRFGSANGGDYAKLGEKAKLAYQKVLQYFECITIDSRATAKSRQAYLQMFRAQAI